MNRYSFTAALAALTLASGAAMAQTDQMVVSVGDLNLTTSQGTSVALRRIDNAAAKFCGGESERDIGRLLEQQKCVSRMTEQAVAKLDAIVAAARGSSLTVASRSGH